VKIGWVPMSVKVGRGGHLFSKRRPQTKICGALRVPELKEEVREQRAKSATPGGAGQLSSRTSGGSRGRAQALGSGIQKEFPLQRERKS